MNEPILPKSWYGTPVRVFARNDDESVRLGSLHDTNAVGVLGHSGDTERLIFIPWTSIAWIEATE